MRSKRMCLLSIFCGVGAFSLLVTYPFFYSDANRKKPRTSNQLLWKNAASDVGKNWLRRSTIFQWADPSRIIFSPSGLWCIGANERLMLWDTRTGASVRILLGRQASGTGFSNFKVYFLNDDDVIVISDHNVIRINLLGRVSRRYFGNGTYKSIFSPAILPNERELALVMDDPFRAYTNPSPSKVTMRRLNLQTGQLSKWKGDFGWWSEMQMEIRKSSIATLLPATRVFLLDARNSIKWSRHVPKTHVDNGMPFFKSIAYSKDEKSLFILSAESHIFQLNTHSLKEAKLFPSADFTTIVLSPDERFLVLGNPQGRIAVYSLETRHLVRQAIFPFSANDLVFSPDGKRLAVGGAAIIPFDV